MTKLLVHDVSLTLFPVREERVGLETLSDDKTKI
jgi:hypothetical protein